MRKLTLTLAAAFCLAAPAFLNAQEYSYSLPVTTVTLEVDAVRESFFAGPYAPFAKKLLGLEVAQEDQLSTRVTGLRLRTAVEADPSERFTVAAKGAEDAFLTLSAQGLVAFKDKAEADDVRWRFTPEVQGDFSGYGLTATTTGIVRTTYRTVQTDSTVTRIPVQEEVQVEKTPEMKAREAAQMILNARKERFNISTGNTDATFSGEALGAALSELDRIEREYLTLFTGYMVTENLSGSYEVTPAVSARSPRYPVFRVGDEGLFFPEAGEGRLWFVEFETVQVPQAPEEKVKGRVIHYREPAVCAVRVTDGEKVYLSARVPVYQLGRHVLYPLSK